MKKPTKIMQKKDVYNTTDYWYSVQYTKSRGNNLLKRWKVSSSWIRVGDFYAYWTKKGAERIVCHSVDSLQRNGRIGDIIQLHKKNRGWYHSIIISKGKKGDYKYAGHTSNRREKSLNSLKEGPDKFRILRIE